MMKLFKDIINKDISNEFEIINYKKNEIIFYEKIDNDYFYYLVYGKVNLYSYNYQGKRKIFLTINDDDIINSFSSNHSKLPYGAIVFEDAKVLKIEQTRLLELMKENFDLCMNILNMEDLRQRRLYRQLRNTTSLSLEKKIAAKLWKYGKDYGIEQKNGMVMIDFKLTNTYLADAIGVSRESVSRSIHKLIDHGLVKIDDGIYYIFEQELNKYYKK
jgi:CRP-like cAMP-binding protein